MKGRKTGEEEGRGRDRDKNWTLERKATPVRCRAREFMLIAHMQLCTAVCFSAD